MLSVLGKHKCQRVCDSISLLESWELSSSCVESIECCDSTTSLRMDKKEGKKIRRREKRKKKQECQCWGNGRRLGLSR